MLFQPKKQYVLPKKLLVLRFSAMGDVILLVPVLKSLTDAYPGIEVTLVTRPKFASFFEGINGVKIFEADMDYKYKGMFGLRDLFRKLLQKDQYDVIVDAHDCLSTLVLRNAFKFFGNKVAVFKNGDQEKKAFTRKKNKIAQALPHTVDRYKAVFEELGFVFPISTPPYLAGEKDAASFIKEWLTENKLEKKTKWVGIAPFALQASKIWPPERYVLLIEYLLSKEAMHFFLFGGGEKEMAYFESIKNKFPNHCTIVAGQMKMRYEIALMDYVDLMVCVDSSNMHLAALTGTQLLSIWGGTHPHTGFAPYGYPEENILQISREELPCRPCSVYGGATCHRGDFACLNRISVEQVSEKIDELLLLGN